MAKPRGRPRDFEFATLLPHLRRLLPGPADRVNLPASRRAGAKVRSNARLLRAWRERDSRG